MRTIHGRFHDFEIGASHRAGPRPGKMRFDDPHAALSFLLDLRGDPWAVAALREIAIGELDISAVYRLTDSEILDVMARQLSAGRLCVVPHERPHRDFATGGTGALPGRGSADQESSREGGAAPDGTRRPTSGSANRLPARPFPPSHTPTPFTAPASQPASAPAGVATAWIGFRVIDEETGNPAANVRLRIRTPAGSVATYATDAAGRVHIADLPEGSCALEEMIDEEGIEVVGVE